MNGETFLNFVIIVVTFLIFVGGSYLIGVNRNRKTARAELEQLEANLDKFSGDAKRAILLWIARQREKLGI